MPEGGEPRTGQDAILDTLTPEQIAQMSEDTDPTKHRVDNAPTSAQLLGPFTVVCLVINRTVGSGIFTLPSLILEGTGSIGGSLLIWVAGGVIAIAGAYTWLETNLSTPFYNIQDRNGTVRNVSVPRSGGEKNFIEYVYGKKPKFLAQCMYGIMYLLLGNISGNAVAFGIYVEIAAGNNPQHEKGHVIGIAIALLTLCAAWHIFTRRGGITLNNIFASVKIALLLIMTIFGWVHAARKLQARGFNGGIASGDPDSSITNGNINTAAQSNFDIHSSFSTNKHDLPNYIDSFIYAMFAYAGFEQPLYVLSECKNPRKVFPRYIPGAVGLVMILYILLVISYYCVVPKEVYLSAQNNSLDMASTFLHYLFDKRIGQKTAERVMAGLIAFSCCGNVVVVTFTAARVKQEIAKEGIFPFSLTIASGMTSLFARFRGGQDTSTQVEGADPGHSSKTPAAALVLQWLTSIILILVTLPLAPQAQYSFLAALYSYVIYCVVGSFVGGGLIYLKLDSYFRRDQGERWSRRAGYIPSISPLHVIIYFLATLLFTIATFIKPNKSSPFSQQGYPWDLMPAIGVTSLLWGVVWWGGLRGLQWKWRKTLVVTRKPRVDEADGGYVQSMEIVEHEWRQDDGVRRSQDLELQRIISSA